jgi:hypothetical protein
MNAVDFLRVLIQKDFSRIVERVIKYVQALIKKGAEVVCYFDGNDLPGKAPTNEKRCSKRTFRRPFKWCRKLSILMSSSTHTKPMNLMTQVTPIKWKLLWSFT